VPAAARQRDRAAKVRHDVGDALAGQLIGRARRELRIGSHRGDDRDEVLDVVEDRDDGGPDQHGVGDAELVRVAVRQPLDVPDHVVTEIAEEPRRHRRQVGCEFDPALRQERPQARQRFARLGLEGILGGPRPAVDLDAATA